MVMYPGAGNLRDTRSRKKIALLHVVEELHSFIILLGSLFVIGRGNVSGSQPGNDVAELRIPAHGSVLPFYGDNGCKVSFPALLRATSGRHVAISHLLISFSNIAPLDPLGTRLSPGLPTRVPLLDLQAPSTGSLQYHRVAHLFVLTGFRRKEGRGILKPLADSGQGKFEIRGKIILLSVWYCRFLVHPFIREL